MNKTNLIRLITGIVLTAAGVICVALTRTSAIAENAAAGSKMFFALSLILTVMGLLMAVIACLPHRQKASTRTMTMAAMFAAL